MVNSYQTKGVDETILQSNPLVQFDDTDDFIFFSPKKGFQEVVIFYPGAMVAWDAYAPLLQENCRKWF